MATARHFGIKPTNTAYNLGGYSDEAFLLVQTTSADQNSLGEVPGSAGVIWHVGPNEDEHQQIIAYTVHEVGVGNGGGYPQLFNSIGDQPHNSLPSNPTGDGTPGDANTARIAFKGSGDKTWSNDEFIALVNEIANLEGNGPVGINNITEAVNYINAGSHWTNFTAAAEATTISATTETPYDYYTVRPCGRVETFTFRFNPGALLAEGTAWQTAGVLWQTSMPEAFIGINAYVIVGEAEDTNWVGTDLDPKPQDCTE